jgi:hypothetical protein
VAAFYTPGRYRVRIVGQVLAENKKGNPELQLKVQPIGYYEKDEYVEHDFPYPRTVYLTLTEGTIGTPDKPGWIMELLRFMGFDGSSFGQLDPEAKDAVSFIGHEHDAICAVGDYEAKEREKWSIYRGGSGAAAKPMEKKSIKALDAKFKALLKARDKKQKDAAQQPAPEPAMAAAPAGEDIPF